jgi:hypothetical protein
MSPWIDKYDKTCKRKGILSVKSKYKISLEKLQNLPVELKSKGSEDRHYEDVSNSTGTRLKIRVDICGLIPREE